MQQVNIHHNKEVCSMIRNRVILLLLLTVLPACVVVKTENQTRIPIPLSPTVFPHQETMFQIGDGGLVSAQPCAAPCFFGIHVGKTHLDDVVSILNTNGISPCSKDIDSVSCGSAVYIGTHSSVLIVDGVGFAPSVPVSVGDVIEKYGNPDNIQIFPGDVPDVVKATALLFWDSLNMRVHLPEIDGSNYVIDNSTKIQWITYFDKTQYTDIRNNKFSQKWKGYTSYQANLDPSH